MKATFWICLILGVMLALVSSLPVKKKSATKDDDGSDPPPPPSADDSSDPPPPPSADDSSDPPPPPPTKGDTSADASSDPPPPPPTKGNTSADDSSDPPPPPPTKGDKSDSTGAKRGALSKRDKANNKDCKYSGKTVEHGKQAYEDICGKLECRDGNLAWYFWPNADYFEECHVPPPLSHGHRQHNIDIPVHGHTHAVHAVGMPLSHGHQGHPGGFHHSHVEPQLHLDAHHQPSMPVNVHIDHVHQPEHIDPHPIAAGHGAVHGTGHETGHPMGSWGAGHGHAPYGLGF